MQIPHDMPIAVGTYLVMYLLQLRLQGDAPFDAPILVELRERRGLEVLAARGIGRNTDQEIHASSHLDNIKKNPAKGWLPAEYLNGPCGVSKFLSEFCDVIQKARHLIEIEIEFRLSHASHCFYVAMLAIEIASVCNFYYRVERKMLSSRCTGILFIDSV